MMCVFQRWIEQLWTGERCEFAMLMVVEADKIYTGGSPRCATKEQ